MSRFPPAVFPCSSRFPLALFQPGDQLPDAFLVGGQLALLVLRRAAVLAVYDHADRHALFVYVNACAARIYYFHGSSPSGDAAGAASERLILSLAFILRGKVAPEGDSNGGFGKLPRTDCPAGSWPL